MLTGDARCQKDECAKVMVKRELAAEKRAHRETKDELENLRATVRLQIEGGVRKWDAEHGVDLRSDLETKTRETRESRDRRNTAEKKARELAEELADLYGIKADLLRQLFDLLKQCKSLKGLERFDLAHEARPGETVPRPCPACDFGHGDEAETARLYKELLATEARLSAVETKAGKAAFSRWRMPHFNVQPAEYGRPLLHYDMDNFILDMLHLAELGVPKTPWKHGILNNASDDAREAISKKLADWKHPLDCRRKDDNRLRAQKWFTGEAPLPSPDYPMLRACVPHPYPPLLPTPTYPGGLHDSLP